VITSNPIFNDLAVPEHQDIGREEGFERATLSGAISKAGTLLVLLIIAAAWSWVEVTSLLNESPAYGPPIFGVFVATLVAALVLVWLTVRNKTWSPVSAPIYALLEGAVIGLLSAGFDRRYPGIVVQAVMVTVTICTCLLAAYGFGWIRVTAAFNRKLSAVISGAVIYYLGLFALHLMGVRWLPMLTAGIPAIAVSTVVVGIAGMVLVSNFDSAAKCAQMKLPKYMEWYLALGLIIALVWMYLEILDLLSKARRAEGR